MSVCLHTSYSNADAPHSLPPWLANFPDAGAVSDMRKPEVTVISSCSSAA
jgi:hypothetical protein